MESLPWIDRTRIHPAGIRKTRYEPKFEVICVGETHRRATKPRFLDTVTCSSPQLAFAAIHPL
jgi:hypothetical protein